MSCASVTFVSADASRTGAPYALLHLLRWLKRHTSIQFNVVLYQDGPLAGDFSALAPTVTLTEVGAGKWSIVRRLGKLPILGSILKKIWHGIITPRAVNQGAGVIYANSVASARLLRSVVPEGCPVVVHVHELEYAIQTAAGPEGMAVIKDLACRYVAMSDAVRQNLISKHGIEPNMIQSIPSFIPTDESIAEKSAEYRRAMFHSLTIPDDAVVVMGCGATDRRKGVDLFAEMAGVIHALPIWNHVHFVWVGRVHDDEFTRSLMKRIEELGISRRCHFVGEQAKPMELFCGCDLFVLPSREEPMGLVALEAASLGKPIVCFADAGGMPDFVRNECGRVVSPMTGEALANSVLEILSSADLRDALGRRASEKVRRCHHIDVVAPQIVDVIQEATSNR